MNVGWSYCSMAWAIHPAHRASAKIASPDPGGMSAHTLELLQTAYDQRTVAEVA